MGKMCRMSVSVQCAMYSAEAECFSRVCAGIGPQLPGCHGLHCTARTSALATMHVSQGDRTGHQGAGSNGRVGLPNSAPVIPASIIQRHCPDFVQTAMVHCANTLPHVVGNLNMVPLLCSPTHPARLCGHMARILCTQTGSSCCPPPLLSSPPRLRPLPQGGIPAWTLAPYKKARAHATGAGMLAIAPHSRSAKQRVLQVRCQAARLSMQSYRCLLETHKATKALLFAPGCRAQPPYPAPCLPPTKHSIIQCLHPFCAFRAA